MNWPSSMSSLRLLERSEVEEGTCTCWIEYANSIPGASSSLSSHLLEACGMAGRQPQHLNSPQLRTHHFCGKPPNHRRKLTRSKQGIRSFPKPAPASPSHKSQGLLDFPWDGCLSMLLHSLPVCMILIGLSMAHVRHPPQAICECSPTYLRMTMSYFNVKKLDIPVPSS